MTAVILAGGEGTRLRPLTNTVAKSLFPICNVPFLEHQVALLSHHGVTDAILLTGYLPEAFEPFAERASEAYGVRLEVSREKRPLGTAGAVRNVLDRLAGRTLVFNGDVLTDLDLGALMTLHRERGAAATIALTRVEDASPYGLVPIARDGRVEAFIEKPPLDVARGGGLINAGTYVLEPGVLSEVPAGEMWSFERQVFPALLESGEPVHGFESDAYWIDIGTPDRYLAANRDALDGRVVVAMDGDLVDGPALLGSGASAAPGARVGPHAVLGPFSRVEAGAAVEESVLLEGARVEQGATVRGSVLGPRAVVGAGVTAEGVVLAEGERLR